MSSPTGKPFKKCILPFRADVADEPVHAALVLKQVPQVEELVAALFAGVGALLGGVLRVAVLYVYVVGRLGGEQHLARVALVVDPLLVADRPIVVRLPSYAVFGTGVAVQVGFRLECQAASEALEEILVGGGEGGVVVAQEVLRGGARLLRLHEGVPFFGLQFRERPLRHHVVVVEGDVGRFFGSELDLVF